MNLFFIIIGVLIVFLLAMLVIVTIKGGSKKTPNDYLKPVAHSYHRTNHLATRKDSDRLMRSAAEIARKKRKPKQYDLEELLKNKQNQPPEE